MPQSISTELSRGSTVILPRITDQPMLKFADMGETRFRIDADM